MKIDIKAIQANLISPDCRLDILKATKTQLDIFTDEVDNLIQNVLMTDLSLKYSQLSKRLEEAVSATRAAEAKLQEQNRNLEILVDEKVKEISESQMATIFALVKLSESRDDDTGAHIERTATLCRLMAERLAPHPKFVDIINEDYINNIYKATPLHDIGKVGIVDAILLKPGPLTPEEFEIMKTHVTIGYQTLAEVEKQYSNNGFIKIGLEVTRYHHEKWDGTGYGDGLAGEDIPLSARIMALVDVYDALRTRRVYKEAYPHEKSCNIIIERSGIHFDPVLIQVFSEIHEEFREVHDSLL